VWEHQQISIFAVGPGKECDYSYLVRDHLLFGNFKVTIGAVLLQGHGWGGREAGDAGPKPHAAQKHSSEGRELARAMPVSPTPIVCILRRRIISPSLP